MHCNNNNCKTKHVTDFLSNGLCTLCNSVKRHEGYGLVKIDYIHHCEVCKEPIRTDETLCWDCKHDIYGCDMCYD